MRSSSGEKSMSKEPRCIEVTASYTGGGKVSIEKYDWSSSWMCSMMRKFEIPEGFSDEQIEVFQLEQYQALHDLVDALDGEELEKRQRSSNVSGVRLGPDD